MPDKESKRESRNRGKVGGGIIGLVTAASLVVGNYMSSPSYHYRNLTKITREEAKIQVVGPEFIGVKSDEDKDTVTLPKGYTLDDVVVTGEFVYMDEVPTEEPSVWICSCDASGTTHTCVCQQNDASVQPEPTKTNVPTATMTVVPTFTAVPSVTPTAVSGAPGTNPTVFMGQGGIGADIYILNGVKQQSRCTNGGVFYGFGQWVLLTNAHCATKMVKSSRGVLPGYAESAGNWISPSTLDGGTEEMNTIGSTWYWYPVNPSNGAVLTYDAAAIKLNDPAKVSPTIKGLGTVKSILDANEITLGTMVAHVGATSGYGAAKVIATESCVRMYQGKSNTVNFCGVVILEGVGGKAIQGGDSGSIYVLKNNPSVGVCLAFAGTGDGTYAICSPLSVVFKGMHLSVGQ